MTAKRFIEFTTQNTDNGEINNGFHDIKTGEWYHTIDNQNATKLCGLLNELHEENEQLKAQLLYDGDGVCNICNHQYLVETGKYYVAKCEKEHEECSKVDLQYCEDFKLARDYE